MRKVRRTLNSVQSLTESDVKTDIDVKEQKGKKKKNDPK